MSGKYTNSKVKKKKHVGLWIALFLALVIFLVVILALPSEQEAEQQNAQNSQMEPMSETQVIQNHQNSNGYRLQDNLSIPVKEGLEIQIVGPYTGIYVEDGTDEVVTDVLMLVLANNSTDTVEYAKITMKTGTDTAEFAVTTLKPGEKVVLLEKNRMTYDASVDYSAATVVCENLAVFKEPLSLQEEKLSFQILNGAINVTNISDQDITGRIAVYYKNKAAGIYYGGITYRILLEDGLKAGEIRQMPAAHAAETGSEILFVTIAQ